LAELKSHAILGCDEFMAKLGPALRDKSSLKEIHRSQRFASRPMLEELLPLNAKMTKQERNSVLKKAHLEHGYSFTEIAAHVHLHYATVSRIVRGT
jgi:putative transposase